MRARAKALPDDERQDVTVNPPRGLLLACPGNGSASDTRAIGSAISLIPHTSPTQPRLKSQDVAYLGERRSATVSSVIHRRLLQLLIAGVVALAAAGSVTAWASTQPPTVSVHVQRKPSVTGSVHITFRPTDSLPPGGYYYAVIVLKQYKHYTRNNPPPCATSSNMQRTDYGYPHPGHPVELALTPAKSAAAHWCRGGVYSGGIYAVPHPPPCNSSYPCRSEPYEAPRPCIEISPCHIASGVVAPPYFYRYPDGLPTPLAKGTRIIGRFQVVF